MPGIARVAQDTAGGLITGNLAPTVYVNGKPIAVLGALVIGHGSGAHAAPTLVQGSATVFAQGRPVCRAGDTASCGHAAIGASDTFAG